jgi:hypothetical protein
MADIRQTTTAGTRMRMLLRFLGMTGVLAVVAAGGYLAVSPEGMPKTFDGFMGTIEGKVFLISAAVVAAWLVIELFSSLFSSSGNRTATSTVSMIQVLAATVALVGFNVFSFSHWRKFDLTRDARFTLPPAVVDELKKLDSQSPTTVVLLQLHKTAGSLSDKPDSLDFAAERKVVEKVQDLIDQFREFGPRFTIVALDTEDEKYTQKVDALTKNKPELRAAIESAPENSILFADDNKKVRRLGFNEFYRVDKTASKSSDVIQSFDDKTGFIIKRGEIKNLVLLPQGREAFARRAGQDDKKPKIALATIHPELSTRESRDEYSGQGLRKTLEAHGFEVVDVLMKKWGGRGGPTPAAETYEEYELGRTENRYNMMSFLAQDRESALKQLTDLRSKAEKASIADLNKMFRFDGARKVQTEADKAKVVEALANTIDVLKEELVEFNKELAELGPKYKALTKDERAVESRRVTDLKAKFGAAVADCDLLIVPRYTVMDISKGEVIRPSLYSLSKEQAEVVKDFMKAGKPVLALFGPTNTSDGGPTDPMGGADDVEKLFTQLGVEFGGQTIVYDREAQAAAERQGDALGSGVQLPPLSFGNTLSGEKKLNPVGQAFLVASRGAGTKFELNRSGFRPIYTTPALAASLAYAPEIAFTPKEAWNEVKPMPEEDYFPKFEPAKPDDPKKGTRDEERRGPFPIGVAFETKIPAEWTTTNGEAKSPSTNDATIRVAALGHGGLFVGRKLDPAAETLLLTTLNWQLKQDDRLAKDVPTEERWQYPRADLSETSARLWRFGGWLGIPALCAYFGVIVWMFRRIR